MQAILIASTLTLGLASSDASGGAAPPLTEILAAWSQRAESVPCGRMSWKIPAEGRNLFGRFDSQWAAASDASGSEMAGTAVFDQQQARYGSVTFSYADGALPTRRIAEARFRAGLLNAQHAYRDLVPYTVRGDYRFPAHTHAQLVGLAQGGGRLRGKGIRRTLVALVRWPGVLVPVALLSGLLIVGNSVLARWRNTRRGRASVGNQPDLPSNSTLRRRR